MLAVWCEGDWHAFEASFTWAEIYDFASFFILKEVQFTIHEHISKCDKENCVGQIMFEGNSKSKVSYFFLRNINNHLFSIIFT